MRFLVQCTNPATGRPHEIEIESDSLHDLQDAVRDKGLDITRITPLRTESRRRPRLCAGRLLAYLTIVVAGAAIAGTALLDRGEGPDPLPRLQASVRFDGSAFRIANRDESEWSAVCVDINGGPANRGYLIELSRIGPGQVMTFPTAAFRDEGGMSFDPQDEKLTQLRITARIGEHGATYTQRWD